MAGDPFGAAAEAGYRTDPRRVFENVLQSLMEQNNRNREMQMEEGAKGRLLEQEYQLKQKYPDPFMAMMAKQFGITMPGQEGKQEEVKSPSIALTEEQALSQIPKTENPADFRIKTETRSVRGFPQTIYRPEKKPLIAAAQQKEFNQLKQTRMMLEDNLKKIQANQELAKFIGPGLVQRPGALADIAAQLGAAPKDFVSFKADVDKAFQRYRKEITGVQAGYPELQWLAVDMPKTTDTYENFVAKTLSGMEQLKKAEDIFLDTQQRAGYAVGDLIKEKSQSKVDENLISQYMKKYPNKSKEEIIKALQRSK